MGIRKDIRQCPDDELSMIVFNEEWLYDMRFNWLKLHKTLSEMYNYTSEQLETLKQDLIDDDEMLNK